MKLTIKGKELKLNKKQLAYLKELGLNTSIYKKNHNKRPKYYAFRPATILKVGKEISDKLAQAMFFFLYLTGARVNEATEFTLSRLTLKDGHIIIELRTLKQKGTYKRRRIPIVLDNRAKCNEREMWNYVASYITENVTVSHNRIFSKWNNMSEYLARHINIEVEAQILEGKTWKDKIITKRFHPHFLRHCRATHMVEYYDWNTITLCNFFGWVNPQMAMVYTELKDLIHAY